MSQHVCPRSGRRGISCKITFKVRAYKLTQLRFPPYIRCMENEISALEGKLAQLITLCTKLRTENHRLRQELAEAVSHGRRGDDKMDAAKSRLEKLLHALPEEKA